MKEENYIASLFEKARQEEPHLTYEEVADNFRASAKPKIEASLIERFFKNIYLNTFLIAFGIVLVSGLVYQSTQAKTNLISANKAIDISNQEHLNESTTAVLANSEIIDNVNPTPPEAIHTNEKINQVEIKDNSTAKANPQREILKPTNSKVQAASTSKPKVAKETIQKPQLSQTTAFSKKKINASRKKEVQSNNEELLIERNPNIEHRSELEIILETALNDNQLKEGVFVKNSNNDFLQLIINANGNFDNKIDVHFAGKKALILKSSYSGSFNLTDEEYVNVKDIIIKDESASFEFYYNLQHLKVDLEKINNTWTTKKIHKDFEQEDHLDRQKLLQLIFADDTMHRIIQKDVKGDFKPFALLSNGHFSDKTIIEFFDNKLDILNHTNNHLYLSLIHI